MAKERLEDVLTFPMAPMLDVMFQILVFFVATYRTDMPEALAGLESFADRTLGRPG